MTEGKMNFAMHVQSAKPPTDEITSLAFVKKESVKLGQRGGERGGDAGGTRRAGSRQAGLKEAVETTRDVAVVLPDGFSEQTVRAEIYRRAFGKIGVALEVLFRVGGKRLWADVVFFDAETKVVFALAEVKRYARRRVRIGRPTRQQQKYDALGLPWRYCDGLDRVDETIEWALWAREIACAKFAKTRAGST